LWYLARFALSDNRHSASIQPLASSRWSAGHSDPVSTRQVLRRVLDVWQSRLAGSGRERSKEEQFKRALQQIDTRRTLAAIT
jgi:hypothetical protein